MEHRGLFSSETIPHDTGYMSLYNCSKLQNGWHQDELWTLDDNTLSIVAHWYNKCSALVWGMMKRLWGEGSEDWIGGVWELFVLNFAVNLKLLGKSFYKNTLGTQKLFFSQSFIIHSIRDNLRAVQIWLVTTPTAVFYVSTYF